jgi:hypothetical protein
MTGNELKKVASTIDGLASTLEQAQGIIQKQAGEISALKAQVASAQKTQKTASEADQAKQANLRGLAKRAAATLLQTGMISSPERAEAFANEVMDHSKAVTALQKFAEVASRAPKTASVVADPEAQVESSDAVWDRHARQHIPSGN